MNPWISDDRRLRSWLRFLLGVLVAVIANFIAIGIAESAAHAHPRQLEALYRPVTMLLLLAGFMLLLATADQVHENFLHALGLGRFPRWGRQACLGIAIGGGLVCVAVIWIALAGNADVNVQISSRTLGLGLLELFILATGAMAEELMFRSYPFQRLLEAIGALPAVLLMSVLFGVAHGANPHASKLAMVNTFAIGVLFCVAYLRTRALWLPWGIHFAWNATLGLVFGLPVSGLTDFAVIVRTRAIGPRWVTGGGYGIEGSAVGTIVILLGFIPVILFTRGMAPPAALEAASVESGPPPSSLAEPVRDGDPGPSDQAGPPRIQL